MQGASFSYQIAAGIAQDEVAARGFTAKNRDAAIELQQVGTTQTVLSPLVYQVKVV